MTESLLTCAIAVLRSITLVKLPAEMPAMAIPVAIPRFVEKYC